MAKTTRSIWGTAFGLGVLLVGCSDDARPGDASVGASSSTDGTTAGPATTGSTSVGDSSTGTPTGGGTDSVGGSSTGTGEPTGPGSSTSSGDTTGPGTSTGGPLCPADCADKGGLCLGAECCPEDLVCDGICCPGGQVCSFNQCETPGAECIDASECGEGEYCEYSLGDPEMGGGEMCQGGVSLATGKCLPEPPKCEEGQEPKEGEPITCLTKCEYQPVGGFEPAVKFHWDKGDVMMAPIVIQLDDDNCDQIVDERDIPEIVFNTFVAGNYNGDGTTRAISIVDGVIVEKWAHKAAVDPVNPGREVAGGDIDGKPGNEIVTCTTSGKVRALDATGTELWITKDILGCVQPTITDLDNDGNAEVLVTGGVLDGATGALEAPLKAGNEAHAADINVDGELDIVHPLGAFNAGGGVMAETGLEGRFAAVADLDLDGKPEIAVIANGGALLKHHLYVWRYDPLQPKGALIVRQPIDINGALSPALCPMGSAGNTVGGGPPTIADFNGDGTPDVAVAGGIGYAVFDGKKLLDPNVAAKDTFLWIKQTKDCSSAATGSSVFDFNGDGSAEVLYGDEQQLRIYRGTDGEVLWQTCNTSGTLRELPLVADVDNDGHADIVAISNSYSSITCNNIKQKGIRVFGDSKGQWVRTRRVWNQHAYHVTKMMYPV